MTPTQPPITCEACVLALKKHGLSTTAECLAQFLNSNSRNVATAIRKATRDGRVTMSFKKGRAFYRFVRLTPKAKP